MHKTFFAAALGALALAGCRGMVSEAPPIHLNQNMDFQERFDPQEANPLFADTRAMRPPVAGTVARGFERTDDAFYRGASAGAYTPTSPVPLTEELLRRGQQRYNIYCSPCHSSVGDGKGVTSKYGMTATASLHDPRIVRMADGEIFHTITVGKNTMMGYADKLEPADRWAVIAYVRALQRARLATKDEVPADIMATLKK